MPVGHVTSIFTIAQAIGISMVDDKYENSMFGGREIITDD
jgi:hypothetical protein